MFSVDECLCKEGDFTTPLSRFGFAIVKLPSQLQQNHHTLASQCQEFFDLSPQIKEHFQYTYTKSHNASADSLYGYSLLMTKSGNKTEQLMLRGIGGKKYRRDSVTSPKEKELDKLALLKNFLLPNEIISSSIIDQQLKNTIVTTHCNIQEASINCFVSMDQFCRNIMTVAVPNSASLMEFSYILLYISWYLFFCCYIFLSLRKYYAYCF